MRLTLVCVGSRGDVQPYVALGLGLKRAGFTVRLATHPEFERFVLERGLDFAPLEGNPRQLLESEAGRSLQDAGRNPISVFRGLTRIVASSMGPFLASCLDACRGAQAIVYSALGFPAYHVAQSWSVPSLPAFLQPISRTRAFPAFPAPRWPWAPGLYNELTFFVSQQLVWQPIRPALNRWRREALGLPPAPFLGLFHRLDRERGPVLYGYSPSILPKPNDWGAWLHVTGSWFLERPADWRPEGALVEFLRSGPPPVYVGFGSMKGRDAAETTRIVLEALKIGGQRGVLITGWGGLGAAHVPESVFVTESVPHDWLFPRVAAVVHHGGAGTTAAGLRAGRPSVLVPFFGDQFLWAERVHALEAGPRPIPRAELTPERLADAIRRAVSENAVKARAAALGTQIQAEDGVADAVRVIRMYLS